MFSFTFFKGCKNIGWHNTACRHQCHKKYSIQVIIHLTLYLIFKVIVNEVISKHQLSFTPLSSFCKLITSSWEHLRPWIMNVNSSSCWLHLRMHLFFSLSYTQSFSYCLPLLLTQEARKVLKMSRSKKPHLFLWPSSAFFSVLFLGIFFFNLKVYNEICWLESEPYLNIDMRDLSWRWWTMQGHFTHKIPGTDNWS